MKMKRHSTKKLITVKMLRGVENASATNTFEYFNSICTETRIDLKLVLGPAIPISHEGLLCYWGSV